MTTILFFADISWEGLHQRPHHLALRFAEQFRVIWIEPVVLSKRPSFAPVRVRKNLFVLSLPVIPYNARQKFLCSSAAIASRIPGVRTAVRSIQAGIVRRAVAACSGNIDDLILFFENIHSVRLVESFKPRAVYYDYIDNIFGFVRLPGHIRRDWGWIIRRADTVFVTSPTLMKQIGGVRTDDIVLVGNGVEYEFFSRPHAETPADIPTDKPVIGYVGAVYPWLDFDLIDRICTEIPSMNVVVIGRAHPEIAERLDWLGRHENFSFLGFREYRTIPAYVHCFTAGIIPFLRNELTEGVNPVKLYEYCAAGIPVVVTDFSPDLSAFNRYLAIGRTHGEFLSALRDARVKRNDAQYRKDITGFASENDWSGKAAEILRYIRLKIDPQ